MIGSFLAQFPKHFEIRRGELVKNGDLWFGVAKDGPSDWVITELTTGLRTHTLRFYTKAEALEKAKSESFRESAQRQINCEESPYLSYEQAQKIREVLEKYRKNCYAAYCSKQYDGDAELAKTARKIFQ